MREIYSVDTAVEEALRDDLGSWSRVLFRSVRRLAERWCHKLGLKNCLPPVSQGDARLLELGDVWVALESLKRLPGFEQALEQNPALKAKFHAEQDPIAFEIDRLMRLRGEPVEPPGGSVREHGSYTEMKTYDLIERMMPPMQAAPAPAVRPTTRPGIRPSRPGAPSKKPSRPWSPAPRPGVSTPPKAEDDQGPGASRFRGARPPMRHAAPAGARTESRQKPPVRELTIESLLS